MKTESRKASLSRYFNYESLTQAQLSSYEENGYLVIPSVFTEEGLLEMREQCVSAWTKEKGEYDPKGSWLQNALLTNAHHHSQLLRDYYFEGPIVDIAEQIIGPNIKGATSQLTFKMRGNTKPFGWHQDNGYGELEPYNALTCLTALEDNDLENGCLWILPGSHKQGQIRVERTEEERKKGGEVVVEVDEATDAKAIPLPMKAGDALIFGCWTLHKSDGNFSKDRDRRVIFLRYADADAVEVYNDRKPRLGRLLRGTTQHPEVEAFEAEL
ncbi:phytanoyl-CoA dioxygenase family protein [Verrucomicrobiaceae bacterium 227]